MAQSRIFYLSELLEQILHILAIDKSLYLTLFFLDYGTDALPLFYENASS